MAPGLTIGPGPAGKHSTGSARPNLQAVQTTLPLLLHLRSSIACSGCNVEDPFGWHDRNANFFCVRCWAVYEAAQGQPRIYRI